VVILVPKRSLGTDFAKLCFASACHAMEEGAKQSFADSVPKRSLGNRSPGQPTCLKLSVRSRFGFANPRAVLALGGKDRIESILPRGGRSYVRRVFGCVYLALSCSVPAAQACNGC